MENLEAITTKYCPSLGLKFSFSTSYRFITDNGKMCSRSGDRTTAEALRVIIYEPLSGNLSGVQVESKQDLNG